MTFTVLVLVALTISQNLTTLHKQNFDLKLELFHRREKQKSLEERCEALTAEKQELEDINDKLISELEMRDKAVEEAVAMIVSLEARLEQLLDEREAKNQAKRDQLFAADARLRKVRSAAAEKGPAAELDVTPKPKKTADDMHSLVRMPSFVSERSGMTENLRSVYIGRTASLASLPRLSEDNFDTDSRDAVNRIASPSLSVLSESSFLSIYGKKEARQAPTPGNSATSMPAYTRPMSPVACVPDIPRRVPRLAQDIDLENSSGSPANVVAHALASTAPPPPRHRETTRTQQSSSSSQSVSTGPTRKRSNSSSHVSNNTRAFNSLSDFIGTNSPLQRLEKMEKSLQAMNEASRPGSQQDRGEIESLARHLREHELGRSYARQEKKDALRRVRTDVPYVGDVNSHHNLPPTPDTISTSTLRRYKNSNDTLSQEKEAPSNDRSFLALSEVNTSRSSSGEKRLSTLESFVESIPAMQPASITAFNSRLPEMGGKSGGYFNKRLPIPTRPRSADETTISHHDRGSGWGDSESSDDDMEIDGNDSASMYDYFMRESLRPTGQAPAPTRKWGRRGGRVSPDLFGFPSTSNGWATTAMFGSLDGQGYQGSAPLAHALDALSDSLPTPAADIFGPHGLLSSPLPFGMGSMPAGPPPPPHRRSSLHARTGSTHGNSSRSGSRHGTAPGTPSLGTTAASFSGGKSSSRTSPIRVSTGTGDAPPRTGSQDSRTVSQPPTPSDAQPESEILPKQRHYPPASGSNTATRNRVLSLFRRSGSHEPNSAASAALAASNGGVPLSAPAAETTFAAAAAAKNAMGLSSGVPSRVRRSELSEENGASATPPPIMRNARSSQRGSVDSGQAAVDTMAAGSSGPSPTEDGSTEAAALAGPVLEAPGSAGGPRKKWLGLGRVTSLRTRAG